MITFSNPGSRNEVDISAEISDGSLRFMVSCGPQHISFSDPRHKVNNGYQHSVEIILKIGEHRSILLEKCRTSH